MQLYQQLADYFTARGSVIVALSGGVDSAVLAVVAHRTLGQAMIAITGDSPSVPARDRVGSSEFCRRYAIPHRLVPTQEFSDPQYRANAGDRCFFCKQELFRCLEVVRQSEGLAWIAEGTNLSDLGGHRPGMRAKAAAPTVIAPYLDLGIDKAGVRAIARHLELDVAEKPASACLASRIPVGTPVEASVLRQVDAAEDQLRNLGLAQVRVRHHGALARIEVPREDFTQCLAVQAEIVTRLRALGFQHVTLDLQGYRTGGGIHRG
ncbi:MAG: ATP-dependent sacrificial sulfur transferase LarE [Deltaproteobacteria bacterium]|nr:ATP-dependent sacrificial sulfur transferase LarE [Deltaproteobacteria bacterium]